MMTKHTPGPFTLGRMGEWPQNVPVVRANIDGTRTEIAKIIGPERVHGETAEIYANAHLFAAAPDLLSELEGYGDDLQSFVDSGTTPDQEWIKANLAGILAAIAKATS